MEPSDHSVSLYSLKKVVTKLDTVVQFDVNLSQERNFHLISTHWNATESCTLQLVSLKYVTITTLQMTKTVNSMEEPLTSNYVSVYHQLEISVLTHSHQKPSSPLMIAMSLNAVSEYVYPVVVVLSFYLSSMI